MGGRGYQGGEWYQGGQSHGGYPENTEALAERAGWYGRTPTGTSAPGGQRKKRTGPKNYQRSDERLKEQIIERLMESSSVDIGNLECEVKDGVVTLSGTVETRSDRYQIENVVDDVWGVKDIANNMRVKSVQAADHGDAGASSLGSSSAQDRVSASGQQVSPKAR
jgi:osmotically-inducible protein OsmY